MHTDITITYPSGQYTCYTPEKEGNSIFKRGNLRYQPDMKLPTLLIWGENDSATPLSDAKQMERLMPDAGLVTIAGAGHYSFLDNPGLVYRVLESFLGGDRK